MKQYTFNEYKALDAMNQSSLKMILDSPLSFKHYYIDGNERKDTAEFKFGRAVHTGVLEPDKFDLEYATSEKIKTCRGKEYDAVVKDNPEKTVLNFSQYTDVLELSSELLNRKDVMDCLTGAEREQVIQWKDEDTGILCKGMVDAVKIDGDTAIVYDLKTAADADPRSFKYDMRKRKYHMQAAFYLDGLKAIHGRDFKEFYFIVAEKKRPYNVGIYKCGPLNLNEGQALYKKALQLYIKCMETNSWPSYEAQEIDWE